MTSPIDAALQQANANTAKAAEPITQNDTVQNTGTSPALTQSNNQVAVANRAPAAILTMDDSAVAAVSSVSGYLKLRDGGIELDEKKFLGANFKLKIESSTEGGSFQPCYCHNYNLPSGQVYTKSYDGVATASNNAAHSNLSWEDSVALALRQDPASYTYTGFEIVLELESDIKTVDGNHTIPAGTKFGYTTPYTAAKSFKAIWDKAISEGKRGQTITVFIDGTEVTSPKGQKYKKLIVTEVN